MGGALGRREVADPRRSSTVVLRSWMPQRTPGSVETPAFQLAGLGPPSCGKRGRIEARREVEVGRRNPLVADWVTFRGQETPGDGRADYRPRATRSISVRASASWAAASESRRKVAANASRSGRSVGNAGPMSVAT